MIWYIHSILNIKEKQYLFLFYSYIYYYRSFKIHKVLDIINILSTSCTGHNSLDKSRVEKRNIFWEMKKLSRSFWQKATFSSCSSPDPKIEHSGRQRCPYLQVVFNRYGSLQELYPMTLIAAASWAAGKKFFKLIHIQQQYRRIDNISFSWGGQMCPNYECRAHLSWLLLLPTK